MRADISTELRANQSNKAFNGDYRRGAFIFRAWARSMLNVAAFFLLFACEVAKCVTTFTAFSLQMKRCFVVAT